MSSCREDLSHQSVAALLNRGTALAQQGKWRQALRYSRAAVKKDAGDAPAQLLLALTLENNNQPEEALQAARVAVKLEPNYFFAQYTLGRLCIKTAGHFQDSIEPLKRALKLKPGDVDTLILLAEAAKKLGLRGTIDYYRQLAASKRYAKRAEPQNELAVLYAEHGDRHNTVIHFVAAHNRAPDNPIIVLNLARLMDYYYRRKQKSIGFYKRFIELTQNNPVFKDKVLLAEQRIKALQHGDN